MKNFRITLRHKDDGTVLIISTKARSATQARKNLEKWTSFYNVNTVQEVT